MIPASSSSISSSGDNEEEENETIHPIPLPQHRRVMNDDEEPRPEEVHQEGMEALLSREPHQNESRWTFAEGVSSTPPSSTAPFRQLPVRLDSTLQNQTAQQTPPPSVES